jgi:hypothetical protein
MFSFSDIVRGFHFKPVLDIAMYKGVCYEINEKNLTTLIQLEIN